MSDRHITRTGDEYAVAMSQLLPLGQAWPRAEEGVLMRTVKGLCRIWGDFELRASLLLEQESDPRSTVELLPDWERNWGLPDPCYAAPQTIGQRQIALVQRMTLLGAQSREFYIGIAAEIGYVITITEYRPFMVGLDRCGDNRIIGDGSHTQLDYLGRLALDPTGVPPDSGEYSEYPYILGPDTNRYYWTVHVQNAPLTWFRLGNGGGQCGVDPHLIIGIAEDLECLLDRWKPAHTDIIYDYSGLQANGPMAGTP
jgi:uncharacterized protein YmfQ (DUF2313 family)